MDWKIEDQFLNVAGQKGGRAERQEFKAEGQKGRNSGRKAGIQGRTAQGRNPGPKGEEAEGAFCLPAFHP
jgi:hypothetical protein